MTVRAAWASKRRARAAWLVLGVLGLFVALGLAGSTALTAPVQRLPGPLPTAATYDPAGAARAAQLACADFTTLQAVVDSNGPAASAFTASRALAGSAANARRLDPRWVQLESAALELDDSLHHDRGDEARQALPLLRTQCARAASDR